MLGLFAFAYLLSLTVLMAFFAGASLLNEHWDRESDRTLRFLALFPAA